MNTLLDFTTAIVAEMLFAFARHVVAAFNFFNPNLAVGTLHHSIIKKLLYLFYFSYISHDRDFIVRIILHIAVRAYNYFIFQLLIDN